MLISKNKNPGAWPGLLRPSSGNKKPGFLGRVQNVFAKGEIMTMAK
jgi:hypothetical protein